MAVGHLNWQPAAYYGTLSDVITLNYAIGAHVIDDLQCLFHTNQRKAALLTILVVDILTLYPSEVQHMWGYVKKGVSAVGSQVDKATGQNVLYTSFSTGSCVTSHRVFSREC
jgi:hypothetical protein